MTRSLDAIRLAGAAFWTAAALAVLVIAAQPSSAADVRIFASGAPAEVAKVLGMKFAETTGNHTLFTVGTLGEIRDKMAAGEKPDVLIMPTAAIDDLEKNGAVRAGSRTDLARVGIGVAVREGAALPDISTTDAVRKMLLAARSIVHPDPQGGGFAGAQIARMMVKLGIADAVKPKVKLLFAIGGGVAGVANGDIEIGLFNISEIVPVKGVTLAGPLPPELQSYINFTGALHVANTSPEPALTFLRALSDPGAGDAWRTGGFEPLGVRR